MYWSEIKSSCCRATSRSIPAAPPAGKSEAAAGSMSPRVQRGGGCCANALVSAASGSSGRAWGRLNNGFGVKLRKARATEHIRYSSPPRTTIRNEQPAPTQDHRYGRLRPFLWMGISSRSAERRFYGHEFPEHSQVYPSATTLLRRPETTAGHGFDAHRLTGGIVAD